MKQHVRKASPLVSHGLELALVGVAAIWGFTFTTVKEAVERVPVFEFLALRFTLAAIVMTAIFWPQVRSLGRAGWKAGGLAGACVLSGYACQTFGLQHTTASNAGFVTGLFVVIAPVLSSLVLRRRPGPGVAAGVVLSTVGLFLLSTKTGFHLRGGDAIVLGAALSFAVQIVVLARYSPEHSPAGLATVQMWVTAIPSAALSLTTDHITAPTSSKVVWAVIITGLFASAAAFLIQTAAQRYVSPSRTALILVSEPVFAGLSGVVVLGEVLSGRQWTGAALILAGMLIAELTPARDDPP